MRLERTVRLRTMAAGFLAALTTLVLRGDGDPTLYSYTVAVPEHNAVKGYVLQAKDYRMSFIPPARWSVRYNSITGTTTLLPPGLEAGISIKVNSLRALDDSNTISPLDRLKEEIRQDHPDALFTSEYTCFAGGTQGWAVEFECRIKKAGGRTAFRRALFDFDDGIVESELRVASTRLGEFRSSHSRVLGSLAIRFSVDNANLAFGVISPSTNLHQSVGSIGASSD